MNQAMFVSYAITGANRGIGFEFVNQLSANPNNTIFAFARNPGGATRLHDLRAQRKNIHIVKLDIRCLQELADAVKYVGSVTGGKLDWLINNAGYIEPLRFFVSPAEYPIESLAKDLEITFETNVIGVSQTINCFLPLLRAGKHKRVICLSSGLGDEEFTKTCEFAPHTPYSISKYALNLAVLKYALALKEEGFIFLAISPGVVNTFEGPPPPPEVTNAYSNMFNQFKTVYPHFQGPVAPQLAVGQMLDVFKQLKPEHSGNFCSQFGPTSRKWL
ncbi:unnamed protein product [Rhizoctonia solani]|uniref:NAD(P)-binding protein n=1 Tax=Rhizoctonia solani TaxID=456999 RepID=A0A8H3AS36_9AGAM|nr:unnamed protein product [Rhizoctonia solani]